MPAAGSSLRRAAAGFAFAVVAEFNYGSSGSVIRFLNEELVGAIVSAFNGRRGQRDVGTHLLIEHLHLDNVTDVVKRECPRHRGVPTAHPLPPGVPWGLWGGGEGSVVIPIQGIHLWGTWGCCPKTHGHPELWATQPNPCHLSPVTVAELRHYFSCALYGYEGYQLDYVGTSGFLCISPCKKGYCQHGGRCQHLPEGPTCR